MSQQRYGRDADRDQQQRLHHQDLTDSDDDVRDDDDEDDQAAAARRARRAAAAAAGEKKAAEITVERTVIHEALIRRAIHKELGTYFNASVVPLESELELQAVDKLVLSFCNIFAIDNLLGFERLTTLKLDNNIIETIENLDHLVNLEWLDLSFNKITKITGLEKLVNLQDLTLFDNEITTIEGLDQLTKLNVLSIGNNQIKDLSFVQGLRRFKNLRLLNLKGNPVCAHDDYHNTIFAYLTNLKYLDYVVIESSQFAKARDSKLDQLLVLESKEKADDLLEKEQKVVAEQQHVLDQANLQGLSTLFQDMVKADGEHPKIKVLPGFDTIQNQYKAAFAQIIEEFSSHMLAQHVLKQQEKQSCDARLLQSHTAAENESTSVIDQYTHLKKKAFKEYTESLDRGHADADILEDLKQDLRKAVDALMTIEMDLVVQVVSTLDEFEKNFLGLISENVLKINACFRLLLDGSTKHTTSVYDLTHHLLERYTKDDTFTDDVDVKAILADKDVLNNAVSTSHENQEAKIALKEDEVREREESTGKKLVKELRDKDRWRDRKRVAEINEFKSREEANIREEEQQQDEDDEAP